MDGSLGVIFVIFTNKYYQSWNYRSKLPSVRMKNETNIFDKDLLMTVADKYVITAHNYQELFIR